MEKKDIVCIVCPLGCRLTVVADENSERGYSVIGNQCKRGLEYGIKEMVNPTRIITSTVKIKNGNLTRLPVKTDAPVPKEEIFNCMEKINSAVAVAPIEVGQVIIANIVEGVNIVATRSM